MVANTITFESIVDSLDASSETLFNLSHKWFLATYPDKENEVRITEASRGYIMAVGNFYHFSQGMMGNQRRVNFIIEVKVRDNKTRIRLSNLKERIVSELDRNNIYNISLAQFESLEVPYKAYMEETIFPNQNKARFEQINRSFQAILKSYTHFIKTQSAIKDNF